jgi:hypothetical protein
MVLQQSILCWTEKMCDVWGMDCSVHAAVVALGQTLRTQKIEKG